MRYYNFFLRILFLIASTIAWGLCVRIIRALTPLETLPDIKHYFFTALAYPGFAFILVFIFPRFSVLDFRKKHHYLLIAFGSLAIVSFTMGALSGPAK